MNTPIEPLEIQGLPTYRWAKPRPPEETQPEARGRPAVFYVILALAGLGLLAFLVALGWRLMVMGARP
jgi:hypothetical protein